jgi:hypothetical protein
MAMMTAPATRPSLGWRLFYAIPFLGWIARDISRDVSNLPYAVVILLTVLILAAQVWGPVVFTLVALAAVPCMFAFFVYISWPFRKE